jgi:hypothetical protein
MGLFWPGKEEGFSAKVGADMTIEEGAVTFTGESIA